MSNNKITQICRDLIRSCFQEEYGVCRYCNVDQNISFDSGVEEDVTIHKKNCSVFLAKEIIGKF